MFRLDVSCFNYPYASSPMSINGFNFSSKLFAKLNFKFCYSLFKSSDSDFIDEYAVYYLSKHCLVDILKSFIVILMLDVT